MPNFYTSNPDLRRRIGSAPWSVLLPPLENGFKDPDETAPRSLEEAVEQIETVLEMVGQLAAEEFAPDAAAVDRQGARLIDGRVVYADATQRQLKMLAEAGLMGFTLPREFGGLNLPSVAYTAAVEIVARADASLMTIFALQGCGETLHRFASREVQERYLPRLCSGEISACMALTEPNAGSDLGAVTTRAVPENGRWRIQGSKCFITNGGADLLLVLARTEEAPGGKGLSLLVAERGPGVEVAKLEEKLGIHGSPTALINFDGAMGDLLGRRGDGLYRCTLGLLHNVRLEVAAQAVGIAQAAQSAAARYARERQQFRRPIDRFAPVRTMLFRNALQIEAARAIVFTTAALVDRRRGLMKQGHEAEMPRYDRLAELLTPLSKYYACEIVNDVTSRALQVYGGYGYTVEYPAERHLRDGRITNIYEGTSEIQVGSLIEPLVDGGLALLFADPLRETEEPPQCGGVLARLRETYGLLVDAAGKLAGADKFAQQGWARGVADATAELLAGLVFLRDAAHDSRSAILARFQAAEVYARAQALLRAVRENDRTTFDEGTFEAVAEWYRNGE